MESGEESLSVGLARWATSLRYEDLPEVVVHQAKRSLLDFLGAALGGSNSGLARTVRTYLLATEGRGGALVIGTDQKLSPAAATLANGTAASVLELDDVHSRAGLHPAATCIPAILSTAQIQGSSDKDVIVAIVVAYELASRLGIATHLAATDRGFHCSSLVGVFGAALGVSKVLGSDVRATTHAVGMAGSMTGGLFDYHGGWLNAWSVNAGRTGREGLLCACLAEHGIAGPVDIFDGPKGFVPAFTGGQFDRNSVLHQLGQEWSMLDTAVKMYPCCRRFHSAIDAILTLRTKMVADAYAVDKIVVETSADSARLDYKTFDSVSAAQMSIPYGVATAFVFGAPKLLHFEEAARRDPRILHLVDRVEVRIADDPAIADSRRHSARVSVSIASATSCVTVEEPTGAPGNAVSDEGLTTKFRDLADPVIGSDAAQRLNAAIWALECADTPVGERSRQLHFLEHCTPSQNSVVASCSGTDRSVRPSGEH